MGEQGKVLAQWSRPEGHDGFPWPMEYKAFGGLHFIQGNPAPYFSLQLEGRKLPSRRVEIGGAAHAEILEAAPHLADLAALHLSDVDGVPMHAAANGFYWYAGAIGGAGERYHGGNGSSAKSPDECAAIFAKYVRISAEEAAALIARRMNKAQMAEWVETQRGRWKAEAQACIARHGLEVFGDAWTAPEGEG